jgi:NADH dehydrogenase (ubiquinone) 1 alpha/beta subcomplex 1
MLRVAATRVAGLRAPVALARRAPGAAAAQSRWFAGGADAFMDKEEATARIIDVVKTFDKVDASQVTPAVAFKDLALDSLDVVEVVMAVEEEFAIEIPDAEADKILSVADAVDYISSHPQAK